MGSDLDFLDLVELRSRCRVFTSQRAAPPPASACENGLPDIGRGLTEHAKVGRAGRPAKRAASSQAIEEAD